MALSRPVPPLSRPLRLWLIFRLCIWQVKLRIGVDEHESYEFFRDFVMRMHEEGGCEKFIVHSRKVRKQT